MQIFKNILLACSLAVAASPVYLRAEDTAAQAAARAALQQKMREVKGQPLAAPAEPANPPAAAETYQTSPPETPQPKVKPPVSRAAKPSETLLAPEPAKPDLIEQARQATRAKMAELQSQSQSAPAGAQPPVFQPVPTQPTPPPVVES